jgi:hypothetical protein
VLPRRDYTRSLPRQAQRAAVRFAFRLKGCSLFGRADEVRPDGRLILPATHRHHFPRRCACRCSLGCRRPTQVTDLQIVRYACRTRDHPRRLCKIPSLPSFPSLRRTDRQSVDLLLPSLREEPKSFGVENATKPFRRWHPHLGFTLTLPYVVGSKAFAISAPLCQPSIMI